MKILGPNLEFLLDHFKSHGYFLSFNFARHISEQILQNLKSLHSKGIVHTDLKPDNIVIKNIDLSSFIDKFYENIDAEFPISMKYHTCKDDFIIDT